MQLAKFEQAYQDIVNQYQNKPQPHIFLAAHTALLKNLLANLWQQYTHNYPHLALLATGGFGRAELYPYSDLDLVIISPDILTTEEEEITSAFIQKLWDYHLHPAPKIGSIQQLLISAKEDITADTAFLESSFIAGDLNTAQNFTQKLFNQRDTVSFFENKILEQEQRHRKFRSTNSLLEPNIKSSIGGLRDIHTLLWLAKAQGMPGNPEALVTENILTSDEARLLVHSHKQLARLRIDLHLITKREEDHFIFDYQTTIAEIWGFKGNNKKNKSERIMQVLFRALKTVKQLNYILIPILRRRLYCPYPRLITELDRQFHQLGDLLAVKNLKLFETEPTYIFKALSIVQTHKDINGFAPKCLRALWHARKKINTEFQQNPVNKKRFVDFFKHGDGLTQLLNFMNLYDILSHYLPAWEKIVGLMQYDMYHIFPVDEHILVVIRNLRRMSMDIHSHELPFPSELMQNFPQKHILYLAALFHDIAKGRDGEHALLGVNDTREFAQTHFLNEEETELLCWLVQSHLLMSLTAQKEDIHNTETIERFCREVKTQTRLIALYLLTCADIRGTNPNIWNSWKANLLTNLYQQASNYFQQGTMPSIKTHKDNVTHILIEQGYHEKDLKKLWQSLGEAYFARHQKSDIIWHTQHLINQEHTAQVQLRLLEEGQTIQVMVYITDKSKLFAKACQFFTNHRLNILDARIYTTDEQFALDTFVLQSQGLHKNELDAIRQNLPGQLLTFLESDWTPTPSSTATATSRRLRHFPIMPQITLYPQQRAYFYCLDIVTADWSGLLSQIACILAEHDIRLYYAKIITLGERVEDSFLISSPKLDNASFQLAFKEQLYQILQN